MQKMSMKEIIKKFQKKINKMKKKKMLEKKVILQNIVQNQKKRMSIHPMNMKIKKMIGIIHIFQIKMMTFHIAIIMILILCLPQIHK